MLRASVFVFECFVFDTTDGTATLPDKFVGTVATGLPRPVSMLACVIRSINVQKTTLIGGEEQRDTKLGSSSQCPN